MQLQPTYREYVPTLIRIKGTSRSSLSNLSKRLRNKNNHKAIATWIAMIFLHLVKGKNQITVDIITAKLGSNAIIQGSTVQRTNH